LAPRGAGGGVFPSVFSFGGLAEGFWGAGGAALLWFWEGGGGGRSFAREQEEG